MGKWHHQQGAGFIVFVLLIAIAGITAGAWYFTSHSKKQAFRPTPASVVTSRSTPNASSSATPLASAEAPDLNLKTETVKAYNPAKTYAFFYTSKLPAFMKNESIDNQAYLNDNPLQVCLNGDTHYYTSNSKYANRISGPNTYIISPEILSTANGKQINLSIIGESWAANGCVRVSRWIDNTHLLRENCGGDLSSSCTYDAIDVTANTTQQYAEGYITYESLYDPTVEQDRIITGNTILQYSFVQICAKDNRCEAIKVYKNLPKDATIPYRGQSPVLTIATTKPMATLDLTLPENKDSLYKSITLKIGDGSIVFDLVNGKLIAATKL